MTPTLTQLLSSFAVALMTPLPPEASGDFAASRNGMIANLAGLCAHEAERGVPVRVWENGAMRALLEKAAERYPVAAPPAADTPEDLSLSRLDQVNAILRRRLIALHEAVEAAADTAMHHDILQLYREMAQARRLGPLRG